MSVQGEKMIRIIAGLYKGRFLKIPDSKTTRPTMDKVRQAIFNAMKDSCQGKVCLDLFAGSGAMALEAISRGAKKIYLNDKDRKTYLLIKDNIKSLSLEREEYEVANLDYRLFLKKYSDVVFDVVFLDPPYRFLINDQVIKEMDERGMLSPSCLIISEQDSENKQVSGFTFKEYKYGTKRVAFYKRESLDPSVEE